MRRAAQPEDDEPKVLHLPTQRTLRWMNREYRRLMDRVPWQLWPDDEDGINLTNQAFLDQAAEAHRPRH